MLGAGLKWSAIVAACLLGGCGESPVPAPAPATSASDQTRLPAGDLFGEWLVAALESPRFAALPPEQRALGDPREVAMLIGVRGIEAASQCVPYLFEHRREGARIEIVGKGWPEPVCARMPRPHEEVFGGIVQGANRVEGTASGGVRLSGPAGAVTLRRPGGGIVANPFGNSPAAGPDLLWGHFRIVEAGGVDADQPIDVAIARWWIEARSGCVRFHWGIVRSDASLTVQPDPSPEPVCERGRSEVELALERVMPKVRRFDWIAPYRVRLSGPAGSVTLQRVHADGQAA